MDDATPLRMGPFLVRMNLGMQDDELVANEYPAPVEVRRLDMLHLI